MEKSLFDYKESQKKIRKQVRKKLSAASTYSVCVLCCVWGGDVLRRKASVGLGINLQGTVFK